MIKVAMAGATGRMGKMILTLVHESKGFKIAGALEYAGHPSIGQDIGEILGIGETGVKITSDPKVGLKASDVLIDFSSLKTWLTNPIPLWCEISWPLEAAMPADSWPRCCRAKRP